MAAMSLSIAAAAFTTLPSSAKRWKRHVRWSAARLDIDDASEVSDGEAGDRILRFRFHLGGEYAIDASLRLTANSGALRGRADRCTLEGDAPLTVESVVVPHAISFTSKVMQTCLLVLRSAGKVDELEWKPSITSH